MKRPALRTATLLAALLAALLAVAVRAHGIGTPQRLNVPSGPYLLSVWTDPDPLRADETHVVVAVLEPATQEPIVTGVTVTVRLSSLTDPALVVSAQAGTDDTNRLLYAAVFSDRVTPGRWQVAVAADGARGASDEVTFEIEIQPARGFNWLWLGLGGLGVALLVWLLAASRPASRRGRRPV